MGLQQSMRFAQVLDTAKVPPARMIAGDCEILKRSRHSEPYLTKSEVRLRPPKIARRLDKQGLRRVPASPEYAGSRLYEYEQAEPCGAYDAMDRAISSLTYRSPTGPKDPA